MGVIARIGNYIKRIYNALERMLGIEEVYYLKSLTNPVVEGDYYDHQRDFPMLVFKKKHSILNNLYLYTSRKEDYVYNQTVTDCYLYNLVHSYMEKFIKPEDITRCDERLQTTGPIKNWFVIVLLWKGNSKELIRLMTELNNGMNILSVEYLESKNLAFATFAKIFDFSVIENYDLYDLFVARNMVSINKILLPRLECLNYRYLYMNNYKVLDPRQGSFGVDLHCDEDVILRPKDQTYVEFEERVYIAPGCKGYLTLGSSFGKEVAIIEPKSLSAGYMCGIGVMVSSTSQIPIKISKRTKFCKLNINYENDDEGKEFQSTLIDGGGHINCVFGSRNENDVCHSNCVLGSRSENDVFNFSRKKK